MNIKKSSRSAGPYRKFEGPYHEVNSSYQQGRRSIERLEGVNRFGERDIRHDHRQDLVDPFYEDENGMRHPVDRAASERSFDWSKDQRSEASREGHYGKGPKGYKRSDAQIYEEACEALAVDRFLDATFMEMEVKDGCVFLRGEAMSRTDKKLAEEIVEHIRGVVDVQNQLIIRKDQTTISHLSRSTNNDEPQGLIKGLT